MSEKIDKKKSYIKAISAVYRTSLIFIEKEIKKFNIGKGQWPFLTHMLFNYDGHTQEELSEELSIDKSNTARALKKLEDEGYVCRKTDAKDARRKNVYVTEKSLEIKEELHQGFRDLNTILTKGFSEDEKEMSRALLYRMLDNIVEYKQNRKK